VNGYDTLNNEMAPPAGFICPIMEEVMTHPVMRKHGRHFKHSVIQQSFSVEGNDFFPLTGKLLKPRALTQVSLNTAFCSAT
jgi:hypothetical protein